MKSDDGRAARCSSRISVNQETFNKTFDLSFNSFFMQSKRSTTSCLMFELPTALSFDFTFCLRVSTFECVPCGFQIWSRIDCMQISVPMICIFHNGASVIDHFQKKTWLSKVRLDIPTRKLSLLSQVNEPTHTSTGAQSSMRNYEMAIKVHQ